MTRLYGRSFKGERVNDYVPDVRFERTSFIGALGMEGIVAPFSFKGTLNQAVFKQYVEDVLAHALKANDVLFMDNCSVHLVKGVLEPLTDKGIHIIFLPTYSPDLNPIENAFSKMKACLRKLKARTTEELFDGIKVALNAISPANVKGWAKHCGYYP